jgi:hypothetical protein
VGDWNADGSDTVGVTDATTGTFFLKNTNAAGDADTIFGFGPGGLNFVPVAGDWDYDQNGPRLPDIVGLKQAFCWLDSSRVSGSLPGKFNCSNQGITTGWSDVYGRGLDCQWIDITGLAAGTYQLRVSVNDTHILVSESDYTNNYGALKVRITPATARPIVPRVSVTAPTAGQRLKVGKPFTFTWEIEDGQNISFQEVWFVPSYKKKGGHDDRGVQHDDPDNRARAQLLVGNLPPNARSFTWTPTDEYVLESAGQILIRTQDTVNLVGTDTPQNGRIRVVPANAGKGFNTNPWFNACDCIE